MCKQLTPNSPLPQLRGYDYQTTVFIKDNFSQSIIRMIRDHVDNAHIGEHYLWIDKENIVRIKHIGCNSASCQLCDKYKNGLPIKTNSQIKEAYILNYKAKNI